jgi:hypothetical protein
MTTSVKLPVLATFVDSLSDPGTGQAARIAFNETGFRDVHKTLADARDLQAFMTMNKGGVGCRVLEVMVPGNDVPEEVAAAYADWVKRFAAWQWAEESHLYKTKCANFSGDAPSYSWPECRIFAAKAAVGAENAGRYPVSLTIDAEGVLPDPQVLIVDHPDGKDVVTVVATLDPCSSFRGGRVSASTTLPPGNYRAVIVNHLGTEQGKPVQQRISSPGQGLFAVP